MLVNIASPWMLYVPVFMKAYLKVAVGATEQEQCLNEGERYSTRAEYQRSGCQFEASQDQRCREKMLTRAMQGP